ncbi:hypothetical protein ES705_37545 [subsurface metagenome]
MAFGDLIRQENSPSTSPMGIGGDDSVIYHADWLADLLYELLVSDFSVDRSVASPSTKPFGIGGDSGVVWHADDGANRNYKLIQSDFSVDWFAAAPSTTPYGIGGDANIVWHCEDNLNGFIYELLNTDLSVVRSVQARTGQDTEPRGAGGQADVFWTSNTNWLNTEVQERAVSDLSLLQYAAGTSVNIGGIGGSKVTLWAVDYLSFKIQELDSSYNLPITKSKGHVLI